MLAVRLDADLEQRLTAVAKRTGRSKSYYAREAIRDKIEELEDLALLEEALKTYDPSTNVPLAEVMRRLGQNPQALLTRLYRSADCLCRTGAAV